jgi:hypothetical protein
VLADVLRIGSARARAQQLAHAASL